MSQSIQKLNGNSIGKIVFALVYFLLALFLIICFKDKIFNIKVNINNYDIYYRLIWFFSFGLFGFSVLIIKIINNVLHKHISQEMSPLPSYLIYYPPIILLTSTISFFIFNLFLCSLGTLFYAGSAFLSFFLGLYIDNFYEILNGLLEKMIKMM